MQQRIDWLDEKGIDPNAMYYTDLEMMEELLVRQRSPEKRLPEIRETLVLVAASTREAIGEIASKFESQTGMGVTLSSGPSSGLARQIVAGASVDIFVSANQQWADEINDAKLSAEEYVLLSNRLVLVVPEGNPAKLFGPRDLNSERVRRIAIAGENVPLGIYAEQALRKFDIFETLADSNKVVRGTDARVTLTYVERAEVEAGIVYATDAKQSSSTEVVYAFDTACHDSIVYPMLLLRHAAGNDAARAFYEYLKSDESIRIFQSHGFDISTGA
ncbi:Molybdate-binding periplasmic protein precursor [Novipirellula aureliae]|uniref:Molybdate-binding periplasmic protein n=2 Tax=Novipirellula aureliae TaxID=2527966 RepID=A0A5C6E6Q5_9BACT|nr:Molybdate-binding periplasmic protein precursor [Novipirellula aureliae]